MDKRLIAINGQFTNRKLTGQERFAFELLLELDKIVEHSFLRFELVIPQDAANVPNLQNINIKSLVRLKVLYGSSCILLIICFVQVLYL